MSTRRTWVAVVAGVLCITPLGYAKSKYHIEQGACEVGSRVFAWWSVTEIDDNGRAVKVWGVDCSGTWYSKTFTVRPLPADPTAGVVADITGTGVSGNAYAVMTYYDDDNSLTSCAGRDSNGEFWEATINN